MKYPNLLDYSERQFQETVVEYATLRHWRVYEVPDWVWKLVFKAISQGTKRRGFTRPGFPDLVMVRPPRLLFAELKREGGKPRIEQHDWLSDLARCPGVEVYFWQPHDWDDIERILYDQGDHDAYAFADLRYRVPDQPD